MILMNFKKVKVLVFVQDMCCKSSALDDVRGSRVAYLAKARGIGIGITAKA